MKNRKQYRRPPLKIILISLVLIVVGIALLAATCAIEKSINPYGYPSHRGIGTLALIGIGLACLGGYTLYQGMKGTKK